MRYTVSDIETIGGRSLSVYVATCELLNLTRVAEKFGLPKSTVSKEIARLEEHFDLVLLERSTRRIRLTEAGKIVYERARQVLFDLKSLRNDLSQLDKEIRGVLRIAAPPSLGNYVVENILPDFSKQYPKVLVALQLSYSFDDLYANSIDLALRVGRVHDDRLVAHQLGSSSRVLVASKAYVEQHGSPAHPEDLSQHNCLRFSYTPDVSNWTLQSTSGESATISVHGNFFCANIPALVEAVRAGLGIAQLPFSALRMATTTDAMQGVLDEWHITANPIFSVYRPGLRKSRALQAMLDHLDDHKDLFALHI